MSDQSQGPGWWLASDGRWYAPEQAAGYVPSSSLPDQPAPAGEQPPFGDAPTAVNQPPVTPATPPAWGTPPASSGYPGANDPTTAMPIPSGPPTAVGGLPPGGYPPGGFATPTGPGPYPPAGGPPAKGGGKAPLIVGIVVLVLVLLGAGVAFALTRGKGDPVATNTATTTTASPTTTAPETTTKPKQTTTTQDTTTTKRTTTTKATTTTAALSATDAVVRQKFIDGAVSGGATTAQAECLADKVEKNYGWAKMVSGLTDAETQQLNQWGAECMSTAGA